MINIRKEILVTLCVTFLTLSVSEASFAGRMSSRKTELILDSMIKDYRNLKISSPKVYLASRDWSLKYYNKAPVSAKLKFLQLNAQLMLKAGYPLLALLYAGEALKTSPQPGDRSNYNFWRMIEQVSSRYPVQYLIENLSMNSRLAAVKSPYPTLDWNYVLANGYASQNKVRAAVEHYQKITMASKSYMPAQYQLAMIFYESGDRQKAIQYLTAITDASVIKNSLLSKSEKKQIIDYANLALGRIFYENQNFYKSATHYRRVSKDSPQFYDALFEQSWSLFMAGSLKHALGTLYGVHSPYFEDRFNPESKILESFIYFWMCRYDQSRNALADFTEFHAKAVSSLDSFLGRSQINPQVGYNLFENLIAGVSSKSIGIPESVLKTAAERSSMLLLRDQYATIIEQLDRLESKGVFGIKKYAVHERNKLTGLANMLQKQIGTQYLAELRSLHGLYENLYDQAQFLYVELLMSQKEQLLGRELHASSKVRKTVSKDGLKGWSYKTQTWEDGKKEFWWDEVGFHVIDVEPVCK